MLSIDKIILHRLNMRLKHPFVTSFGTTQDKDFFIIEVIDEDGYCGYGESVAFDAPWYTEETVKTTIHMLTDFLIPLLKKNHITHPRELVEILNPIRRNHMAKAALEGAIWDLYAKRENISLQQALGGEKTFIDVGMSIGIQPTMIDLLNKVERALEDGYKRIKLKIKPGHDVQLLRHVRRHFPNIPIMVDANSAYTLDDLPILKQLDDFDLMMIEQPLQQDDFIEHAKLQDTISTPICLDESIHSLNDVKLAIKLGSCKVINIKSGRVGGLTESIKIHDYCQKHHIPVWCGGMLEAGVGRAHNVALASLTNFSLPGDTAGSSHYWETDIITPEVVVKDGKIKVPTGAGIGYAIDWEALRQFTVAKQIIDF